MKSRDVSAAFFLQTELQDLSKPRTRLSFRWLAVGAIGFGTQLITRSAYRFVTTEFAIFISKN
jgi:hypothetical protein